MNKAAKLISKNCTGVLFKLKISTMDKQQLEYAQFKIDKEREKIENIIAKISSSEDAGGSVQALDKLAAELNNQTGLVQQLEESHLRMEEIWLFYREKRQDEKSLYEANKNRKVSTGTQFTSDKKDVNKELVVETLFQEQKWAHPPNMHWD